MRCLFVILLMVLTCGAMAQTPEQVVQSFVEALNKKDVAAAAKLVEGGVVTPYVTREMGADNLAPTLSVTDVSSTINGDFALVTFQLTQSSVPGAKAAKDHLVLIRSGSDWLIDVPGREGALGLIAFMLTNPPVMQQAQKVAEGAACLSNLKQLSLGLIMVETDNDDILKVTAANWQKQIQPYVKNQKLFTCPEDPPGTMSYSLNAKLAGKDTAKINDPAKTVLVYEGKDGQLNFRHNGRACVAFCDGHAKLITKEEAKTLLWK